VNRRVGYALYLAFLIGWIVLRIPDVERFTEDSGLGHQLAGAQQLLAGEHPFIDFRSSYGPGVFYLTALGQTLSGGRIAGEWVLEIFANAVVYLTLLVLIRKVAPNRTVTVVLILLATFFMPRLWKYFIALGPALCLLASWSYFDSPRRSRLLLLAATVALSGLLRQDLGVYSFLCALTAVLYTAKIKHQPAIRLAGELVVFVVAAASPWLLWAAVQGGLGSYLQDSINISLTKSQGLSKPFPAFHWRSDLFSATNRLPWLYTFFFLQPLFAALVCALSWKTLSEQARLRWLTSLVVAGVCMVQASHRSDFDHLQQAVPLSFVLIALLAGCLVTGELRKLLRGAVVAWAVLALFSFAVFLSRTTWPSFRPAHDARKMAIYAKSKDDFLAHVTETFPRKQIPAMSAAIKECTSPDERILVLPFFPEVYYLSDRLFGAEQMMTASGYYDSDDYQRQAIANLDRQDVPIFVNAPAFTYDNDPARALPRTHPLLWDYLQRSYDDVRRYRRFTVAVRRGLADKRARELRDCLGDGMD
jgi:hypothetical protein